MRPAPRRPNRLIPLLLCALAACGEAALPLPECFQARSCAPPASRCQQATCVEQRCEAAPLPDGAVVDATPYCYRVVCDGAGNEVEQYFPPNCAIAAPVVTSISTTWVSVAGGQQVTLAGTDLQGAVVTLGGKACSATATDDGTSATFTTPWALPAAPANTLSVANLRGITFVEGRLASAYALVPWLPTLTADGIPWDWDQSFTAVTDGVYGSNPARLHTLSVAYDDQALWLFVEGGVTPLASNALVVYLDAQYGQPGHAGVTDLRTLTDATGALDDACTADLVVIDPAFRAQFCAGSVRLSSVALGQGAPATDAAGLRRLVVKDPAALDWGVDAADGSTVAVAVYASSPIGAELQIPWSALGLAARPAGSTIGIFVRAVTPSGSPLAGQLLPPDWSAAPFVGAALQVQVY